MKILTFGEALFDIINGSAHLGGAPLNLAAHLAKLGSKPAVISAVGRDELGKNLLLKAEEMGIDTSYILTDEQRPTGTVTVELEGEGIPHFIINEGVAWDAITLKDGEIEALTAEEWGVFCFGTLAQRSEANRKTLQGLLSVLRARHIFYDVNLRPGFYEKEWIAASLACADIVKMNSEEAGIIYRLLFGTARGCTCEDFCRLLVEKYPGISIICITKGPEGAAVYHKDSCGCIFEEIETTPVKVADTVGAGDAFSAGFLYAYLSGSSILKAAGFACELGTYVASKPGAIPGYSEEILKKVGGLEWRD
ncbi:carbohydrate kinase [Methanosarcina sp. KYL-1]|uniref:carbohydrate kinase family protein n=1 Tax=Methanosarcina sp. KYL-1 TaxID=2602068 RepID=UPI0021007D5B|nr:carbohydrate kinase [Methanosarcina sp. KYL-1]MCQ1534776.1 carbohydrate kinase [Methanosarcina sp. KYL-1]